MPKFRRATPPNSQVIRAHLLQFKPIFDPFLKNSKEALVYGGGALVKLSHFLARVRSGGAQHPLGAEIQSFEIFDLG